MKIVNLTHKMVFLFVLALGITALMAQDISPWQYVRHSAVDDSGRVHVRFNSTPSVTGQYQLYSLQDGVWTEMVLTNPELLVYETLLPHSEGQMLSYRLRADYEVMGQNYTALNPGYLSSNVFPPPLESLAYVADDPVGDNVFPLTNLDLTGCWFGYSDTKLYCALTNLSQSYPSYLNPHEYYFYFAGLANSATLASVDSCFYGMLFGDEALMVIFPSLYKISNITQQIEQFWRLGYIQYEVVDGILYMSSNISDLSHDSDFEDWPPANNSMGFMAGTLRLLLDVPAGNPPNFSNGDLSQITQLIFENYNYQPDQNTLPVISDITTFSNETGFYLQCTYYDADRDFPLSCKAILDDLTEIDFVPTIPDFSQPVTMTALMPSSVFNGGTIRMSDNNIDFVEVPFNGTSNNDEVAPPVLNFKVYPNPFNPANALLHIDTETDKTNDWLKIFNSRGQLISSSTMPFTWDGTDMTGQPVGDGVYILKYHIYKYGETVIKKIVMVR